MSGTPLTATRRFDQVSMAVTAAHDSAGTLISNSTDSYEVHLINTGNEAIEYKVDSGPWFKLDVRASSSPLAISLATSAIRLRLAGVGPTSSAQLDITSLTGAYSAGDDVLDLGSDAPGGGVTTFAALTDAASVDLPSLNTPLANALAGLSGLPAAVVTLTDGVTIDTDASLGSNFKVALTGTGHILANPTNMVDGGVYNWRITNGGAYTLDFGSKFKWDGGTAPTITSGSGAIDLISGIYYSDNDTLICAIGKDKR